MNDITNYAISVMYAGLSEEVKATKVCTTAAVWLRSLEVHPVHRVRAAAHLQRGSRDHHASHSSTTRLNSSPLPVAVHCPNLYRPFYHPQLEEAKATKLASMLKGVVAYAKASSGPFFFGSEPTVADLAYFSLAEGFTGFMPGCDLK